MLPEEFAQQYFDLWQESVGKMMQDPRFASKMAELTQHANGAGNDAGQGENRTVGGTGGGTSRFGTADLDGSAADTIAELSRRLEECEQRIAVLEALVRHHIGSQAAPRRSNGALQRELQA